MSTRDELRVIAQCQNLQQYHNAQADRAEKEDTNLGMIRIGDRDPNTGRDQVLYSSGGQALAGVRTFNASLPLGATVRATKPIVGEAVALDSRSSILEEPSTVAEPLLPFKVLYTLDIVTNPTTSTGISSFYVGGDRPSPAKLLEVPLYSYNNGFINNFGAGKSVYIAGVRYYLINNATDFGITRSFGTDEWEFTNNKIASYTKYKGSGVWISDLINPQFATTPPMDALYFLHQPSLYKIDALHDKKVNFSYQVSQDFLSGSGGGYAYLNVGSAAGDVGAYLYLKDHELSWAGNNVSALIYQAGLKTSFGIEKNSSIKAENLEFQGNEQIGSVSPSGNFTLSNNYNYNAGDASYSTERKVKTFLFDTILDDYIYSESAHRIRKQSFFDDVLNTQAINEKSSQTILFSKNCNSFIVKQYKRDYQYNDPVDYSIITPQSHATETYDRITQYFLYDKIGDKTEINNASGFLIQFSTKLQINQTESYVTVPGNDLAIPLKINTGSSNGVNTGYDNIFFANLIGTKVAISQKIDSKTYLTIEGVISSYAGVENLGISYDLNSITIKVDKAFNSRFDSLATDNGTVWTNNNSIFNLLYAMGGISSQGNNSQYYDFANPPYLNDPDLAYTNFIDNQIYITKKNEDCINKDITNYAEVWELRKNGSKLDCVRTKVASGQIKSLKVYALSNGQINPTSDSSYRIHSISYCPPR